MSVLVEFWLVSVFKRFCADSFGGPTNQVKVECIWFVFYFVLQNIYTTRASMVGEADRIKSVKNSWTTLEQGFADINEDKSQFTVDIFAIMLILFKFSHLLLMISLILDWYLSFQWKQWFEEYIRVIYILYDIHVYLLIYFYHFSGSNCLWTSEYKAGLYRQAYGELYSCCLDCSVKDLF